MTAHATEPLEVRLGRLAELHRTGALDAAEFASAKAAILGPSGEPTHGPTAAPPGRSSFPRSAKRGLLVGLGWFLACMSSVFTVLQAPAGPFLCSGGTFRAGMTSETYGGTTSFDIDSVCVAASGDSRAVSSWAILGLLFVLYTVASLAFFRVVGVVLRAFRSDGAPSGQLGPDLSVEAGMRSTVVSAGPGSAWRPTGIPGVPSPPAGGPPTRP